jgi:hypothetical protein
MPDIERYGASSRYLLYALNGAEITNNSKLSSVSRRSSSRHRVTREGIHRSAWKWNSQKFAAGFRRWQHACGGKGWPAGEVGLEGEDFVSLIRRYPLITFFVLAYVLSWWPWILYALDLLPQPIVGFGPFLAAIVVLTITRGKTGVVGLLRRMVRWRVGLR